MDKLLKELKAFYKKEGRGHLPWRTTRDPYKILVSEVMLQQTQVSRVIDYYNRWIKKFPTAKALAEAPLSDVLKEWQGLGYNRRGKYLWESAKILSKKSSGRPSAGTSARLFSQEYFASLPGVGPYTAGAVVAFAFNKPTVFIETNIRTVFLHYFYANVLQNTAIAKISDAELLPLVAKALKQSNMQPRDFYAALMDYGSYLKSTGVRTNSKSKHYSKQSKFEGSTRQKRAAKLRKLLAKGASDKQLEKLLHS